MERLEEEASGHQLALVERPEDEFVDKCHWPLRDDAGVGLVGTGLWELGGCGGICSNYGGWGE